LQSFREKVGRDAGKASQEIRISLGTKEEISNDEERPPFAEDVECAGESAVLVVGPSRH